MAKSARSIRKPKQSKTAKAVLAQPNPSAEQLKIVAALDRTRKVNPSFGERMRKLSFSNYESKRQLINETIAERKLAEEGSEDEVEKQTPITESPLTAETSHPASSHSRSERLSKKPARLGGTTWPLGDEEEDSFAIDPPQPPSSRARRIGKGKKRASLSDDENYDDSAGESIQVPGSIKKVVYLSDDSEHNYSDDNARQPVPSRTQGGRRGVRQAHIVESDDDDADASKATQSTSTSNRSTSRGKNGQSSVQLRDRSHEDHKGREAYKEHFSLQGRNSGDGRAPVNTIFDADEATNGPQLPQLRSVSNSARPTGITLQSRGGGSIVAVPTLRVPERADGLQQRPVNSFSSSNDFFPPSQYDDDEGLARQQSALEYWSAKKDRQELQSKAAQQIEGVIKDSLESEQWRQAAAKDDAEEQAQLRRAFKADAAINPPMSWPTGEIDLVSDPGSDKDAQTRDGVGHQLTAGAAMNGTDPDQMHGNSIEENIVTTADNEAGEMTDVVMNAEGSEQKQDNLAVSDNTDAARTSGMSVRAEGQAVMVLQRGSGRGNELAGASRLPHPTSIAQSRGGLLHDESGSSPSHPLQMPSNFSNTMTDLGVSAEVLCTVIMINDMLCDVPDGEQPKKMTCRWLRAAAEEPDLLLMQTDMGDEWRTIWKSSDRAEKAQRCSMKAGVPRDAVITRVWLTQSSTESINAIPVRSIRSAKTYNLPIGGMVMDNRRGLSVTPLGDFVERAKYRLGSALLALTEANEDWLKQHQFSKTACESTVDFLSELMELAKLHNQGSLEDMLAVDAEVKETLTMASYAPTQGFFKQFRRPKPSL